MADTDEKSASKPGQTIEGGQEAQLGKEKAIDQVSNDASDAKVAPEDKLPKDNSHNFN